MASARKHQNSKGTGRDNASTAPLSPTDSESSGDRPPTAMLEVPPIPKTTSTSSSRFSLKGRRIFGSSKKKDEPKEQATKRSFGLFGSHKESALETDPNMLSPVPSNASSGPVSNPVQTSSASTTSSLGSASHTRLFVPRTNASSGSDGSRDLHPGDTHSLNSTSISTTTSHSNRQNAITGTGTYTMGKRSLYHSNTRADHSSVNQNQLSSAIMPSSMSRSPAVQAIIDNLLVVSERDLPFVPDTIESIITLLDLLIGIYRNMAHVLEEGPELGRGEMVDIDLALSAVEVVLRRTLITDGLAALDAEYFKRKEPRSKDLLEKDIIRVSSQPNANNPKMAAAYNQRKLSNQPLPVVPQSQAMYV